LVIFFISGMGGRSPFDASPRSESCVIQKAAIAPMFDALVSTLTQQYLKVRQQYRHAQALWAYRWTDSNALPIPRFILFGRGRSGTTALLSMLDDVPALHCEGEVLHNYVPYPYRHVLGRSARAAAPGYGCKILSYQVQDVQNALEHPASFIDRLWSEGGFQILYLRRTKSAPPRPLQHSGPSGAVS
jgi:hypothetical protein